MGDELSDHVRDANTDGLFTRRQWLTRQAILHGASVWHAIEAVASTAIEHPEWDMDEKKTWEEWGE